MVFKSDGEEAEMKVTARILVVVLALAVIPALAFASGGGEQKGGVEKKPTVVLLWLGAQTPYGPPFISNFHFMANAKGWNDIPCLWGMAYVSICPRYLLLPLG